MSLEMPSACSAEPALLGCIRFLEIKDVHDSVILTGIPQASKEGMEVMQVSGLSVSERDWGGGWIWRCVSTCAPPHIPGGWGGG